MREENIYDRKQAEEILELIETNDYLPAIEDLLRKNKSLLMQFPDLIEKISQDADQRLLMGKVGLIKLSKAEHALVEELPFWRDLLPQLPEPKPHNPIHIHTSSTQLDGLFLKKSDPFEGTRQEVAQAYRAIRGISLKEIADNMVEHPERAMAFLQKRQTSPLRKAFGKNPQLILNLYTAAEKKPELKTALDHSKILQSRHLDVKKLIHHANPANPAHSRVLHQLENNIPRWKAREAAHVVRAGLFHELGFRKIGNWFQKKAADIRQDIAVVTQSANTQYMQSLPTTPRSDLESSESSRSASKRNSLEVTQETPFLTDKELKDAEKELAEIKQLLAEEKRRAAEDERRAIEAEVKKYKDADIDPKEERRAIKAEMKKYKEADVDIAMEKIASAVKQRDTTQAELQARQVFDQLRSGKLQPEDMKKLKKSMVDAILGSEKNLKKMQEKFPAAWEVFKETHLTSQKLADSMGKHPLMKK